MDSQKRSTWKKRRWVLCFLSVWLPTAAEALSFLRTIEKKRWHSEKNAMLTLPAHTCTRMRSRKQTVKTAPGSLVVCGHHTSFLWFCLITSPDLSNKHVSCVFLVSTSQIKQMRTTVHYTDSPSMVLHRLVLIKSSRNC